MTQPTPEQMERAEDLYNEHRTTGWDGTDVPAAIVAAILQSDQQQAERIAELEGIVKRVQSAAKTIMIGEADELARLREEKRADWQASKSLDSEREMNAILTAENERLEVQQAELLEKAEAMAGALEKHAARFQHCADMIAESRTITGTLRAERTIKAKHYALEAEQSLTAFRQYQEGRKDGPEPGSADWLKQSPNFHPGDLA